MTSVNFPHSAFVDTFAFWSIRISC